MHKGTARNNVICERDVPSNDEVRRYRLPQSKYRSCLPKQHIDRSDTRAIDRHQTHRCSTTLLLVPDQPLVGWLPWFAPRLLPNPKYSGFCGRQRSERRFCFFITDEGENFVHLGLFDFRWDGCIRQCFCPICHP